MKLKNLSFAISTATIMAFGSLFSPAYSAGKDITIVIAEEPDIVDPCEATRSVVGKIVKQNVTETLTEINPADGSVTPRLATSWKQTDNLTWEFNIRKGIKFHDGEDLNAQAVVKSINRALNPKYDCEIRTKFFGNIKLKASAIGSHTISVKTESPQPIMPALMGTMTVVSPNTQEAKGVRDPKGTGPYLFNTWTPGQSVTLKRFDGYWGDKPEVENATYVWRNESAVRAAMVKTGEADIAASIGVQDANDPKMDFSYFNSETSRLRIDLTRAPLNDIRVRKAIGLMFNFEWSNKTLFYDLYARINSFWENSDMAATGKPSKDELIILNSLKNTLPSGIIDSDVAEVSVSSTKQLDRKNLRMASKLLDDAGWEVGDDGLRKNKNGATLDIEILNDSQAFTRIIEPFIENLKSLGVNAVHTKIDNAQMTERERSFDFDIVTGNFPMSFTPGSGLKQYFGSETADVSIFNKAGIKSEVIDELIEVVMAAKTRDELKVAVKTLDRVLRSYYFWIPQWFKDVHTVAYYDYYEHPENLPPYDMGLLDFWWINNEKYNELKNEGAF